MNILIFRTVQGSVPRLLPKETKFKIIPTGK